MSEGQEEPEEENYEGMTEEEIAEAKERKKALNELKQKYDTKIESSEDGEYKKRLDLSTITNIKKFKVKPPKKPFIIASIITVIVIIIASIASVIALNRPPEPAKLVSAKLSQTKIYQDVGEMVDLRGLTLNLKYSDDTAVSIPLKYDMIFTRSANITSEYNIKSYNSRTYITFLYQGHKNQLNIILTNYVYDNLSVDVYDDIVAGDDIKFENIVALVDVFDASKSNNYIGQKRIDSNLLSIKIGVDENQITLSKSQTGFIVPSDIDAGDYNIEISYNTLSFNKEIEIQAAVEE